MKHFLFLFLVLIQSLVIERPVEVEGVRFPEELMGNLIGVNGGSKSRPATPEDFGFPAQNPSETKEEKTNPSGFSSLVSLGFWAGKPKSKNLFSLFF
jgi:hypothetical protein